MTRCSTSFKQKSPRKPVGSWQTLHFTSMPSLARKALIPLALALAAPPRNLRHTLRSWQQRLSPRWPPPQRFLLSLLPIFTKQQQRYRVAGPQWKSCWLRYRQELPNLASLLRCSQRRRSLKLHLFSQKQSEHTESKVSGLGPLRDSRALLCRLKRLCSVRLSRLLVRCSSREANSVA